MRCQTVQEVHYDNNVIIIVQERRNSVNEIRCIYRKVSRVILVDNKLLQRWHLNRIERRADSKLTIRSL